MRLRSGTAPGVFGFPPERLKYSINIREDLWRRGPRLGPTDDVQACPGMAHRRKVRVVHHPHREWQRELEMTAGSQTMKVRCCDADDRHSPALRREGLADYVRVAA